MGKQMRKQTNTQESRKSLKLNKRASEQMRLARLQTYLEPSFHLELVQGEHLCNSFPVACGQVLVSGEAPLEVGQLPLAEHGSLAALERVVSVCVNVCVCFAAG